MRKNKLKKEARRPSLNERMAKRPLLHFLFGAPVGNEQNDRKRSERARLRTARVLALWQDSPLRRLTELIRGTFFMTTARAISILFLPLALATTFRCLLMPMLTDDFPLLLGDGIAGTVLLFLSLLFITEGAPMHEALKEHRLLSYLFFDTLALPRPYQMPMRGLPGWLLLIPGGALGTLSIFVSPLILILAIAGTALCILALSSPDFSLLLVGILLPITPLFPEPTIILAAALTVTALAYAIKLLLGKRLFRFEATDLFILLFAVAILLAGIFSSATGGFATAIPLVILVLLGYFLTANLLSTRRTVMLLARGMLFVATILSALGIFRGIIALLDPEIAGHAVIATICGIVDRIFATPGALATYLLLLFPILFSVLSDTERLRWRYIPALLLLPGALGLTLRPAAYLVLVLTLLLFALFNSRVRPRGIFLLFGIAPCFLFLLPEAGAIRLSDIFAFLGIEGEVLAVLTSIRIGAAAFLGGLWRPFGIGTGHADSVIDDLLAQYGQGAAGAGSLYLTMGIQLGAVGLLAFLLLLTFAIRDSQRTLRVSVENAYRSPAIGVTCGILGALLFAPYENIFSNHLVLLLFFMLLGLLTAIRRAALYEDVALLQAAKKHTRAGGEVSLRLERS